MKVLPFIVFLALGASTLGSEDCGGVVSISSSSDSHISFNERPKGHVTDFCVWTLQPANDVQSVEVTVNQNILENYSGLIAYFPNSTGLTSYKLPRTTTVFSFDTAQAFLTFSNSYYGDQFKGFTVTLRATRTSSALRKSLSHHLKSVTGEFEFPVEGNEASNVDRVSVTLQKEPVGSPYEPVQVKLSNVKGFIEVYTLLSYAQIDTHSLKGRYTSAAEFGGNAYFPFLFLVQSGAPNQQATFKIGWHYGIVRSRLSSN